jgi:hypothetical protein
LNVPQSAFTAAKAPTSTLQQPLSNQRLRRKWDEHTFPFISVFAENGTNILSLFYARFGIRTSAPSPTDCKSL